MLSTGILAWYWLEVHLCVNDICPESSGNCCLEARSRKLRVVSPLYFMRSHRCQPWSTSKSLSLWPGTGWNFEEEHLRYKHQPGWQFHRCWGREGLLCPGIPSGCSWCLCRQLFGRLCSLLMLILRISRFSNLVDCQWSGWISFWLELILCGMMWYAFYWDIGMILAWYWLEMHLCKRHLPWIQWELFFGNSESETESCVSFVFHKVSRMSALIYFQVAFPSARHWLKLWWRTLPWQALTCLGMPSEMRERRPFPGFQVAAHGASAYSWCWGSDSVDPDWRVLRVLWASAVGDIIVPSSEEKGTAHSQALKQVIEEKKKMGFELRIEF